MKFPFTFQTENAKLISGTLTNVSSSSIKTAAQVKDSEGQYSLADKHTVNTAAMT